MCKLYQNTQRPSWFVFPPNYSIPHIVHGTKGSTIHTQSHPRSSDHVHKSIALWNVNKLKLCIYTNYLNDHLMKYVCVAQFFHLPFFAGNCPVASRYLLTRSSCTEGRQGWYLLYSIVYSPFPYGRNSNAWINAQILYFKTKQALGKGRGERSRKCCFVLHNTAKALHDSSLYLNFFIWLVKW